MTHSNFGYHFVSKINAVDTGIFILFIIIITLLVHAIRYFAQFIAKIFPSKRMMILSWIPLLNFSIYFIGLALSFYLIFEPSREFLIAFIVSSFFAIGFAAKDVITDIIAGIILLFDKPFQVGDRITFQGHYGDIISIGLRSVKLLTLDESIVTIPNNRFLTDSVSSSSAGDLGMMAAIDVHVSPKTDVYLAKTILQEQAEKNQYIDGQKKIVIVCKEILNISGTVSFVMTVKCILKDARQEKAFQTDFLLRVNKEFKKNNVE